MTRTSFLRMAMFFGAAASAAFIAGPSVADAQVVQKALENVRESLDSLITTKDNAGAQDLALRVETYRKVLDLSIAEIKDLRVRLLAIDDLEKESLAALWRDAILSRLSDALAYSENERELFEKRTDITLDDIKALAEQFRAWRDETYKVTADQIREYLLIQQESEILGTAWRRYNKVAEDVQKLLSARIKGARDLSPLLKKAEKNLKESDSFNAEAITLFEERYFRPLEEVSSSSTATSSAENAGLPQGTSSSTSSSTPETASGTIAVHTIQENLSESSSTVATSSAEFASSTASSTPHLPPSPPSIKDLVRQSLVKAKDAYQVFIEMSNLVRKLLN